MRRIYMIAVILVAILTACQGKFDETKAAFQFSGIIPKTVTVPKADIKPIEEAQAALVVSGYSRLAKGMSILLLSFIISMAFSNGITHTISSIGMGIGGYLSLDGMLKIWVAEYLPYLIWGAVIVIIGAIAYKLRKKSIINLYKGIKEKCTSPKTK